MLFIAASKSSFKKFFLPGLKDIVLRRNKRMLRGSGPILLGMNCDRLDVEYHNTSNEIAQSNEQVGKTTALKKCKLHKRLLFSRFIQVKCMSDLEGMLSSKISYSSTLKHWARIWQAVLFKFELALISMSPG